MTDQNRSEAEFQFHRRWSHTFEKWHYEYEKLGNKKMQDWCSKRYETLMTGFVSGYLLAKSIYYISPPDPNSKPKLTVARE